MKKLFTGAFLIFFLLGSYLCASEPESDDPGTISQALKNNGAKIGGYGALAMKFTGLDKNNGFLSSDSNFAFLIGAKGGLLLNKKWTIGAGFSVLTNKVTYQCGAKENSDSGDVCFETLKFIFGYGGGYFSYTAEIKKYLKIETGFLIGGGSFKGKYKYQDEDGYYGDIDTSRPYSFFVLEPEVQLIGIVTDYLAFGLGVSYRIIAGIESSSAYNWNDLSGLSFNFDVRLGVF